MTEQAAGCYWKCITSGKQLNLESIEAGSVNDSV